MKSPNRWLKNVRMAARTAVVLVLAVAVAGIFVAPVFARDDGWDRRDNRRYDRRDDRRYHRAHPGYYRARPVPVYPMPVYAPPPPPPPVVYAPPPPPPGISIVFPIHIR
jgi:hypothetical protein